MAIRRSVSTSGRTSESLECSSPTIQQFFVPGPLPGANDIIRKHHMVYVQLKRKWGERCQLEIVLARLRPISYCEIEFVWQEKHGRRDDDNIMFGQKFVLDALKHAGIILDDRRKFVKRLIHSVVVYPPYPGVQVTIREVPRIGQTQR
jgi:Holliday junction resolvase RusA-like endonuclease